MPSNRSKADRERASMLQEKDRLEKQIAFYHQRFLEQDAWLITHTPATQGYQQQWETWRALQAYIEELRTHLFFLDESLQSPPSDLPETQKKEQGT